MILKRLRTTILLVAVILIGMSGTAAATGRDLEIDIVALKSPVSSGEKAELVIQTKIGAMCLVNA